jgi:hypothetical protein
MCFGIPKTSAVVSVVHCYLVVDVVSNVHTLVIRICFLFIVIHVWHHRLCAACVLEAFEQVVQTFVLLTKQFADVWSSRSHQFEQWQSHGVNIFQFHSLVKFIKFDALSGLCQKRTQ